MKKTYLAKRNALLSPANFSWGAFALMFAVLMLIARILSPDIFWSTFAPIFRVSNDLSAGSRAIFNSFGNTAKLAMENEKLTNYNVALTNENQALLKKAESLYGLRSNVRGVIAGVVARPPESPYDTFVLSAGKEDGIDVGMRVFSLADNLVVEGGTPIGVVSSVSDNFSRATLFSSNGMTVNGWVGQANLPLTIRGVGAGIMNASIQRSAGISVGDTVFAPGPGMLPIGYVARVDGDPSSPSVTLRIMPSINLFSVAWVVIKDIGTSLP